MIFTTYFANLRHVPEDIVPVSISLYPPRGFRGISYRVLAPSKSILFEYKRTGDWDEYVRRFNNEILKPLDPSTVVNDLMHLTGYRPFALVCYEKDPGRCHRSLVAAWLRQFGHYVQEF